MKDGTKTALCDYCRIKTSTLRNVNSKKGHSYKYVYNKDATVFKNGTKTGTCIRCGRTIIVSAPGTKLTPTIKTNVSSVRLRVGQVTSAVKVSGLAKGDEVRSWISENTSIVKVDRTTGKMTAGTKTGTAAVTITLRSGLKKTIRVIVQKMAVRTTKLTGLPSSVTVSKGKTVKLTPVRTPVTSQEKVTYTIGNKAVASVTSNGVVKGRKKGKTNLTVQSGARKVTVLVIVTG
ncbi:MAG: Ig-like domain-containing protein [Lachnospiraceae bacterium]